MPIVVAASVLIVLTLLLASVVTDLRSRRIPNNLVLLGLVLAAFLQFAAMMAGGESLAGSAVWSALTGLLVGGGGMLALYLLRACGAGDVKLMAMVGAFVGPDTALIALILTLVAGGAVALIYMLIKRATAKTMQNVRFLLTDWLFRLQVGGGARLSPLDTTAVRLPYALAITIGTAVALWLRLRVPGH